jgi:DNA polymerase-3 subunit beta
MGSITVNRTELGKALDFASLGLAKYPVCPVLAGMLVTVSAGTLELAAFDYETAAKAEVHGQADGSGRVLVTGAELAAVVKSLPKGRNVTAELSVYDDGLIVVCDGIEATLSSLPLEEYPQLPALPAESGVTSAEAFARSVARVAACAGTDDTLPALTCVKLAGEGGALQLAATDRYRLAVDSLSWTGPDGAEALISAKTLTAFAKKADKHGKVSLHLDAERSGFSDGTRTLITRNSPAEFVKYRSRMPAADSAVTTVLADAGELGAAVTRAGKLVERGVPVTLDITEDGITVLATDGGEVKGSQTVAAALDGPPITARFNPPYLASVLAGVDGEAFVRFTSASKPALVTSADEADGYIGVCMPVRNANP